MTVRHRRARRLLAAPLVAALFAAACGGDDAPGDEPAVVDNATVAPLPSPTPEPPTAPPASPTPDDDPTVGPAATPVPTPVPGLLDGAPVPPLALVPLVELDQPIALATRSGSDDLWIAEKTGRVWQVAPDGRRAEGPVLDIGGQLSLGNEQGLLGVTFSPDGSRLYVDFTDRSGATNVVEYAMAGDVADDTTARTVLRVDQPAANHNAGDITFGPDGYLYVTLGDGGGAGDPFATGQDPTSLLGSILRIDPLAPGSAAYSVPDDNPFVDGGGRPEIFLFGVRNPWRISFDRDTGDLWIADVGQNQIEEVNVAHAAEGGGRGANLGWSLVEGSRPFNGPGPPDWDYLAPIHEYTHADGCSVTGGYVYRGPAIPELRGVYVFADYCTSALWALLATPDLGGAERVDLGLQLATSSVVSFGEGPDGELYVLSFENVVYRLEAR